MYSRVRRCVESYLAEQGRRDVRTDRVFYLDVTNREVDGYCYLFFAGEEPGPALVAKAAEGHAGRAVFEIEYENLRKLEGIGMNAEHRRTPEPLGRWDDDGTLVTLQSALPGALMKNVPGKALFSQSTAGATIGRVVDWWKHLQQLLGVQRHRVSEELYEHHVLEPIRLFERRYVETAEESELLDRRYRRERSLLGAELPFMVRHGDFCTANMALHGDRLGVFDWEFPLEHQIPLFDLFYFFSSTRFPHAGRRGESGHFESFASVFWEDHHLNRTMRRCIVELCEAFRIPQEAVADLLVLSLVQVANMKYEGLLAAHGAEETDGTELVSSDVKRDRWKRFEEPDIDLPLACIQDGAFRNLALVAQRGLPDLAR